MPTRPAPSRIAHVGSGDRLVRGGWWAGWNAAVAHSGCIGPHGVWTGTCNGPLHLAQLAQPWVIRPGYAASCIAVQVTKNR